MPPGSTPSQEAGAFRRSAEQAELSLVLQAARTSDPSHFIFRRAARATVAHPPAPSRRYLKAVLEAFVTGEAEAEAEAPAAVAGRISALVCLAGHLETRGLLAGAAEAL